MNKTLATFLVLAVTIVLLSLLFAGNQSLLVVLAITIVLVVLILVVGDAPELLPSVLKIILQEIRRILRP